MSEEIELNSTNIQDLYLKIEQLSERIDKLEQALHTLTEAHQLW